MYELLTLNVEILASKKFSPSSFPGEAATWFSPHYNVYQNGVNKLATSRNLMLMIVFCVFLCFQIGNLPTDDQFTELLKLKNVRIVNIKDPQPGNWTLDISASSAHTLRITGECLLSLP